jgi:TPR repeat protein
MRSAGASLSFSPSLSKLHDVGICELPDDLPDQETLTAGVTSGDPESQYIQAVLHYKGQQAALDWNRAQVLMKKSADQGHPLAQYSYGYFSQSGVGRTANPAVARKHYRRASENGIQGATTALLAIQSGTVLSERDGRSRPVTGMVDYQRPRRQPDITFGSLVHTKRSPGQYSPHHLPRRLQKTNPLGL